MTWQEVFDDENARVLRRWHLVAAGAGTRLLTSAVRSGALIRLRRDYYALPGTDQHLMEAVRVGGRLGCTSALADWGVFAFDTRFTHVHMGEHAARLRSPRNRFIPLTPHNRDGTELHWVPLLDAEAANLERVGIVDALLQAALCQPPTLALASLDNAIFLKLVGEAEVSTVFSALPQRLQYLRELVDGRSESGQETVLRMILIELGLRFEVQPRIPGVGRVDFLVEGRLILEADSRLAHQGWEAHLRDANRDINAGELGYLSLRPLYEHTMYDPDRVKRSIMGTLRQKPLE